jgi:hypothetical protein
VKKLSTLSSLALVAAATVAAYGGVPYGRVAGRNGERHDPERVRKAEEKRLRKQQRNLKGL